MPLSAPGSSAPPAPLWDDAFATNTAASYTVAGTAVTIGSGALKVNSANGYTRTYKTTGTAVRGAIVETAVLVGTAAPAATTQFGCLLHGPLALRIEPAACCDT